MRRSSSRGLRHRASSFPLVYTIVVRPSSGYRWYCSRAHERPDTFQRQSHAVGGRRMVRSDTIKGKRRAEPALQVSCIILGVGRIPF